MNSQFAAPRGAYAPTASAGSASPPRGFGYVSGATPGGDLSNGYVGGAKTVVSTGGGAGDGPDAPAAPRRQGVNLASPDPNLSQQAFTHSQFTTNLVQNASARAAASNNSPQSGGAGAACGYNPNGGNGQRNPTPPAAQDSDEFRRSQLRRYKESRGGGGGGRTVTSHPQFSVGPSGQQQMRPTNGRGNDQQQQQLSVRQNLDNSVSSSNNGNSNGGNVGALASGGSTFVAYTLSDPGLMYKGFPATTSWFRVMHVIVPAGKVLKRIHFASMLMGGGGGQPDIAEVPPAGDSSVYSVRLVDASASRGGRNPTLWAEHDLSNTENFQVYTMDLTNIPTPPTATEAGGLYEIQAYNSGGLVVLFSSATIEF